MRKYGILLIFVLHIFTVDFLFILTTKFYLILFGFYLMSGSCHFDRASNVKIGFECQIFVIVIF